MTDIVVVPETSTDVVVVQTTRTVVVSAPGPQGPPADLSPIIASLAAEATARAAADAVLTTNVATNAATVATETTNRIAGDATNAAAAVAALAAATAAQAASQPLDSDLTAIAALTTTPYGRAFLALADAAAGRTSLGLGTAATQPSSAFDASGLAAAAQATANAAVPKGTLALNVKDYGALGDGSANDTAAINAALAALTAGDTLYFPRGRYMTDGGHTVSVPSTRIVGPSGRAQTFNSSAQIYLRNGANVDLITITANQVTVRDLSLYGNKANQSGTSRGLVTPATAGANYLLLDAVWVDSFKGDGYSFESSGGTLSATIQGCESRLNDGYGMHFYGTATDVLVANCYIDQNVLSGVQCSSGDLSLTGCHIWGNGTGSSGDLDGLTFQSSAGCRVINCYIESNTNGAGIRFKTGANKGHIVIGCDIWNNGTNGIYAFSATNCVFSGNAIRQNNFKAAAGAAGAGLVVEACTAMTITGNQFFASGALRQTYGFAEFGAGNTDIRFADNMSRAVDHLTGGVLLGLGTKADLGSFVRYKTADQSVVSSTALVDDVTLQFPVAVGEVWELAGVLFAEGATTGDLNVRVSTPASPVGYWRAFGPAASNVSASASSYTPAGQLYNTATTVGMIGAGVIVPVQIQGLVTITTAGTLVVRWAQGTSDVTATIVHAGSYLRATRVAQ